MEIDREREVDGVQGEELINRDGWARETDCKANS